FLPSTCSRAIQFCQNRPEQDNAPHSRHRDAAHKLLLRRSKVNLSEPGSTAMRRPGACLLAIAMVLACCGIARAEATQVRFARQLGLGYLQFYVMQDKQIVERRAAEAGLGKVTTTYSGMGTPTAIADALLSGNVDVIGVGLPVFLTMWDKTRAN